ncbi:MAG: hypothetical protein QM529_02145 [Hydrotalea sp.]|nr:hypothetical protein [Hydrotalea sp.]
MFHDLSLYGIFKEYRALWFVVIALTIIFGLAIFLWKKMGPFNISRGKVVYSLVGMGLVIFVPLVLLLNSIFTPPPATFFILDQTDGFPADDATLIKNLALRHIDETKGNSDIYFYEIGKFNGQLNPVVEYHIPPRKKVMSLLDSVPEAEEKIYQQKYEEFRNGVQVSLNQLVGDFNSPSSYILEGVSSLAQKALPLNADKNKHLIIISDLLQNSPAGDFYNNDAPPMKNFLVSAQGIKFSRDDLTDVAVTIYVVPRPFYDKNPAKKILVEKFWRDYFFDRGAYKVDMVDVRP